MATFAPLKDAIAGHLHDRNAVAMEGFTCLIPHLPAGQDDSAIDSRPYGLLLAYAKHVTEAMVP